MASIDLSLSATILRLLRVTHASIAPVRIVSHPVPLFIEGEEYAPFPFTATKNEIGTELVIETANGFGLAWLESVGECDAVLSFAYEIQGFPPKIVGRMEGKLIYREGQAIFVVSNASVFA